MIRIETEFGLRDGRPAEAGACHLPRYKAGRVSGDRVRSESRPIFHDDFSELTKSVHEFSSELETLKAERGGGFLEF
jgi:hypothetical protein